MLHDGFMRLRQNWRTLSWKPNRIVQTIISTMKDFKKTIDNTEFSFKFVQEGADGVFLVNVENQTFRMVTDDEGIWGIWQQVPSWIKHLEEDLSNAIEKQHA